MFTVQFSELGNFCIPFLLTRFLLGPHYFEDLADMMDAEISELFNADFQDNSFEEVVISRLFMFSINLHFNC